MLLNTFEIDVRFIENNINFELDMDAKFSPRVKDVISYDKTYNPSIRAKFNFKRCNIPLNIYENINSYNGKEDIKNSF